MKTMLPARFLPVAPLLTLFLFATGAHAEPMRLDLAGIKAVAITGDAAAVTLTARPGGVPEARLAARRSGWFSRWYSSWFYNDCRTKSRMWREGAVLHVEVAQPGLMESSDCEVELTASLPPGVKVDIALAAVQARLDGRFSTLDVETRAGNIAFDGALERADLRGTAMRAVLDVGEGVPRAVTFAVGSLDATLDLGPAPRVGWRVGAKAALVDTALPNDPAAGTQVAVSGDYVRLSIR